MYATIIIEGKESINLRVGSMGGFRDRYLGGAGGVIEMHRNLNSFNLKCIELDF